MRNEQITQTAQSVWLGCLRERFLAGELTPADAVVLNLEELGVASRFELVRLYGEHTLGKYAPLREALNRLKEYTFDTEAQAAMEQHRIIVQWERAHPELEKTSKEYDFSVDSGR